MANIINLFSKKRDQTGSFEELLQPHVEHLYRVAYRLTSNQVDAEDLVQDFLLQIYPRFEELQQIEKLKAWLARSLYNRFIDNIRRNKRNPVSDAVSDEVLDYMPGSTTGPDHDTEAHLMQSQLHQLMQNLNEDQRHVVMLHDMEGYTLSELEQILDTPIGTLKSRLHRARKAIKDGLKMEPSASLLRLNG